MSRKFILLSSVLLFVVGAIVVNLAQAQRLQPLPLSDRTTTELLINGGFETDANTDKLPDSWSTSGTTTAKSDKLKCDKPGSPVAHSGSCAFMFRGNPNGSTSSLTQKVADLSSLTDGSTVQFSAYLDPRSSTPGAIFAVTKIILSDTTKLKLKLLIPAEFDLVDIRNVEDYVLVSNDATLNLSSVLVSKVKVKLLNDQTKGKFLVDDASLTVSDTVGTSTPVFTPTIEITATATSTSISTSTPLPTMTDTPTMLPSSTSTVQLTGTFTPTTEASATATATATDVPSDTPTRTATNTPTSTLTSIATITPSATSTIPTATYTSTPTNTPLKTPVLLLASDGALNDRFGGAVAVSGNTAVIGATNANGELGAAYIFTRSGNVWTQQQELIASDAAIDDLFGWSVAISGDVVVVGAFSKNNTQGAAYVFTRSGIVWTQQQKLTASDAAANDSFGLSVAVEADNTILVSAYQQNSGRGAVYVFPRSGSVWFQQQKLTASDAAGNDWFGYSVAISGDTAVIGAYRKGNFQGAAYVFTRSGLNWFEQQKLTASDGASNDDFGYSVSISGDIALIGAYGKANSQGRVYAFTRSGTTWTEQQILTISDPLGNDFAGAAVTISGNVAAIGAYGKSSFQGAVYLFTRSGSIWLQQQKLMLSGTTGDNFGHAVALDLTTLVIGAWLDDVGANTNQGSAWVYIVP